MIIASLVGLAILVPAYAFADDISEACVRKSPVLIACDKNLASGYPSLNRDGTVNVVVEIPAGTNEKWEVAKPSGELKLEQRDGKPRIVKYVGYPGNYGMIPQTILPKEAGGDGDPLDIIAIGRPAKRGEVVRAKIIGVLKLKDRGEADDKLIAVMPKTALYSVRNIKELNERFPGIASIVETWFSNYKGAELMSSGGYGSKAEAKRILHTAMKSYRNHSGLRNR
jgi:inorganic pyrophosphatase